MEMKMANATNRLRAVFLLVLFLAGMTTPVIAADLSVQPPSKSVRTNRTVAKTAEMSTYKRKSTEELTRAIKKKFAISESATDSELQNLRVFSEPLVPMNSSMELSENKALAKALLAFVAKNTREDFSDFTKFLQTYPNSRWRAAIEANLAQLSYDAGYLSQALSYAASSWDSSKTQKDADKKLIGDKAFSNLVHLESQLGMVDSLDKHLTEAQKRKFAGTAELLVRNSKDGLWTMKNHPEEAFRCGPLALDSLISVSPDQSVSPSIVGEIRKTKSSKQGTSLAEMEILSQKIGLNLQMAKRRAGAPIIVPSIMHWRVGHFSAITEAKNGRYRVQDPTFGTENIHWLSERAVDAESDGYFLVKQGKLPNGWLSVPKEEGQNIWGKGWSISDDPSKTVECPKKCLICPCPNSSGSSKGMAANAAFAMNGTLNIADTPVSYQPALGPAIDIQINYNYLEGNQPAIFSFTNLSACWSLNWVSYLIDNGSQTKVSVRGGGYETYENGSYSTPDVMSQATLSYNSSGGGSYTRHLRDGSTENFTLQNGSGASAYWLMTSVVDPQGNAVLINWDPVNFRVESLSDANGQLTTFKYVSNSTGTAPYYLVSEIIDPCGRKAVFSYDSTNSVLLSITDSVGNVSSFFYDDDSSFIHQVTTPYGSTSFAQYTPQGYYAYVPYGMRTTYPDGSTSVIESWRDFVKESYFWDREATQLYPNDPANHNYAHCETTKWLLVRASTFISPVPSWTHKPSEAPVVYYYPGESVQDYRGSSDKPVQIARQVAGVPTTATVRLLSGYSAPVPGDVITVTIYDQLISAFGEYTNVPSFSYTIKPTDTTVADVATGLAAAANSQRFLQSYGFGASSAGAVVTFLAPSINVVQYGFGVSGSGETLDFASSNPVQTAELYGSVTTGDVIGMNIFNSNLPGGLVQITHTAQAGDTLATILQDMATQANLHTDLQSNGITASWTGGLPSNITRFVGQGSLQNVTQTATSPIISFHSTSSVSTSISGYVTGSGTERYNYSSSNGIVEYTTFTYNPLGYVTSAMDACGRRTDFQYASNNIDLLSVVQDGSLLIGAWEYDSYHRPLKFKDASLQETQYAYNSAEQLTSTTDALSNTTSVTYNIIQSVTIGGTTSGGDALSITAAGNTVNYTTISGDNPSRIAAAFAQKFNALGVTGLSANSTGDLITIAAPSGSSFSDTTSGSVTISIAGTNSTAYPTQIEGPLSGTADVTTFTWNFTGTPASITDSEGKTTSFSYDNLDRKTKTTFTDGTTEEIVYSKLNAVQSKDRGGRWTNATYNNLGQLSSSTDPIGRQTNYYWCSCGALAELVDAAGNSTEWHHDLQGRVIQKVYADGKDVDFAYNSLTGRVSTRTDALGQVSHYIFNCDGSLQSKYYTNAVNTTSAVSTEFDSIFPRTKSIKNGWGKNSYAYSAYAGRVLLTGSPTTNDVVNILIRNSSLSGGEYNFQYQVTSGDTTLALLATSIKNAINANSTLSSAGVSATNSGATVTITGTGTTSARPNTNGITNVTFSLIPGLNTEFNQQVYVTIYDWNIPGGKQNVQYTIGYNGEPLSNVASSMASDINSNLSWMGITATSSGPTLSIKSTSTLKTSYAYLLTTNLSTYVSITGGATEVAAATVSTAGGNTLVSTSNNVIANSNVSYTYDALNRVTNRSINASANSTTWSYDGISRVTSEVNPLGTFGYTYVDNTPGSSKGVDRLSAISYPNGQTSNFSWLPNIGDQRLQQIANLNASSALLSQFNYAYNAPGEITQWQQQQNSTNKHMSLDYDDAGQLTAAPTDSGSNFKIYISGTTSASETFSVTAYDGCLTGTTPVGQETATYNASASTSASTVATNLASQINSVMGSNLGLTATASGSVVSIATSPNYATSFSASRSGQGTTLVIQNISDYYATATVSGTPRTGDSTSITAYDTSIGGGQQSASYTVQSGDTPVDVAAQLTSQFNSTMSNISATAVAQGNVIYLKKSPSLGTTFSASAPGNGETIAVGDSKPIANRHTQLYYFYDAAGNRVGVQGDSTGSFPGGLTTTATKYEFNNLNELTSIGAGGPIRFEGGTTNPIISAAVNITKQVTIGGSVTPGDQVSIVVHDTGLVSNPETVSYTVQSGDTTTTIATALRNAINADTLLTTLGVSATSSAAVITISSTSKNATTYTATKSPGASETMGLTDSYASSATVSPSTEFAANPSLAVGVNTATVTAVSGGGTAANNSYPITVSSSSSQSLTYDDNGNMTSDGTNSYAWDAEDRLIQITFPGSGNNTQFTYDALGRCVKIVETVASSVTSTKQFVWCGAQRCEERDGSGSLSNGKQFFPLGQVNFASGTPTNYFYTQDHLGSTREMTKTVSGTTTIEAQYGYDPYGIATKLQGSQDADFQYAGYYMHARSGLNLPVFRAYSSSLGRFINRDPLGESGGINLYGYVGSNPIMKTDPLGLAYVTWRFTHPIIIFEDSGTPSNIGYWWHGVDSAAPDDVRWSHRNPWNILLNRPTVHYDDALMRQAVKNVNETGLWQPAFSEKGHGYCVFGVSHHCDDYLNAVLNEYEKLKKEKESEDSTECKKQ